MKLSFSTYSFCKEEVLSFQSYNLHLLYIELFYLRRSQKFWLLVIIPTFSIKIYSYRLCLSLWAKLHITFNSSHHLMKSCFHQDLLNSLSCGQCQITNYGNIKYAVCSLQLKSKMLYYNSNWEIDKIFITHHPKKAMVLLIL